jgi:hypothetical protein
MRTLETQLRNMPAAERPSLLAARGLNVQAVEEYLSGAKCGGLGEAALSSFFSIRPEKSMGTSGAPYVCGVSDRKAFSLINVQWTGQ